MTWPKLSRCNLPERQQPAPSSCTAAPLPSTCSSPSASPPIFNHPIDALPVIPPTSESKLGWKKTRAGQQRSSVKRQRKCIFSGFLQLFIAQSPNALQSAKCLVNPLIGSSPPANETDDNYCTTATQFWKKHILFREQLLLARIYFYKNTMCTKL